MTDQELMSDLDRRIAALSPQRRALLELYLMHESAPPANGEMIPRREAADAYPLSFAQQRLWFLDQLHPGRTVYHIPMAIRLSGPLSRPALEQSLVEMIRRHEALRTTFPARDGQPVQVIAPAAPTTPTPALDEPPAPGLLIELCQVDLQELPEGEREAEAWQRVRIEVERPFDLARGPLFRAALLQLDAREHILLLSMHHIVSDGWSTGVLFRELSALYAAFVAHPEGTRPSPLPELPIQYPDFAVWQRQWLQGEMLAEQLAYWKQRLGAAPPPLALPTDYPRPAVPGFRGARQSVLLSHALTESLKALGQTDKATLFMVLLAAFQTLLHRYTGQDDLVVGTPTANRARAETEGLIGCFVNTLVLRTDLSGDPTFRELLQRVRETVLSAFAHQDLPFEKLIEELQPQRDLSHSPLFQVMFILQNVPTPRLELPGLTLRLEEIERRTAMFDLTLSLTETDRGLHARVEYNTDLYADGTITRLLSHYQRLLEGVVEDPARPLSRLPLLTAAERRQLLVEWNATRTEYPREQCIHQLFETQAEKTPAAAAVLFEDEALTYEALNRKVNQLAHYLRKQGVGPDVLVGIFVERSLAMVVGLLGILKAGGAYVPLDPAYPPERLSFMLRDIRVPVLLTQAQLADLLPEHTATPIYLDRDASIISQESEANPTSATTPEHLAYVMYTSGSTGQPKGVCIPHRGVVRLVKGSDYADLTDKETFLQLAPLSFDASTFEIWGPLLNGGRLVVFPPHTPSLAELGAALQRFRVTTLWLTASLFHQMIEQNLEGLRGLRQLLAGGEVLSASHVRKALRELDGCRIINGYGPTESTTFTCCHRMTALDPEDRPPPIGRPIANTEVYLLDHSLQPVPVGVPGELYIGGDGLARGYLNRPDLTAARFVRHPFHNQAEARLYRTGDVARYLPDGNIEFLGRRDRQVKLRGFRIELEEIEAALAQHPGVAQNAVVVRTEETGEKRLVAYFASRLDPQPSIDDLRRFLRVKLPEYMIPAAFVRLEALPLSPNGKVDREALPAPDASRPEMPRAFVAPRDSWEQRLAPIWESNLGISPVGVQDNYFDLGGHSLLAVRLVAQIEKALGRKIPVAALFQSPTIEQLAGILRAERTAFPSLVALQPNGSRPPFFCIHGRGDGVLFYRDLCQHLGSDQPVYGVLGPTFSGQSPGHGTVEEMAARYVREIRTLQAEGPYALGGYSFGGVVAFEMAQQLLAQGQQVALLALFDTGAPGPRTLKAVPRWIHRHAENLASRTPAARAGYVMERVRALPDLARIHLWNITYRYRPRWARAHGNAHAANLFAYREYTPRPYPGLLTLFRAEADAAGRRRSGDMGWGQFAGGGLAVQEVPGDHDTLLREPHVGVLAAKLSACLEKAWAKANATRRE